MITLIWILRKRLENRCKGFKLMSVTGDSGNEPLESD
jgi:hypothetical protein